MNALFSCLGITSFSHLCLCRGVLAIIPLHMLVETSEVKKSETKFEPSITYDLLTIILILYHAVSQGFVSAQLLQHVKLLQT